MKIPLLDINRQLEPIREEIDQAIKNVIDGTRFILGEEVRLLEDEIASYCGVKHAIGCASGSDALLLALQAAGVGKGDSVITTAYSFFATAGSIWRLGATPVFVDIDPETYNIDVQQVATAIRPDTRAIMPVHLFGQMSDIPGLREVAGEIPIIEDAAQSIGAVWNGAKVGQLGDVACLSFFPSKNLGGFGDGGMIVTNSDEIAERTRSLRVHGSPKKSYYHTEVGYNSRLDTIQAAVLRVKLPYLNQWSAKRYLNAEKYNEYFKNSSIKTPFIAPQAESVYNQYVIQVSDRQYLMDELKRIGIGCAVYYPLPLPLQPCFSELGYQKGSFTVAESVAEHSLAIPVFPELTADELEYVARQVMTISES